MQTIKLPFMMMIFMAASLTNFAVVQGQPAETKDLLKGVSTDGENSLPTMKELSERKIKYAKETSLSEDVLTQIDELISESISNLQAAEKAKQKIAELSKELQTSPERSTELQDQLSKPLSNDFPDENEVEKLSLEEMSLRLKEAENAAATARDQLQKITAEIERRALRRPKIPELKSQIDQKLDEISKALSQPPESGANPKVSEVRTTNLQILQYKLRQEKALLEQEAVTFEGTVRYKTLQKDYVERIRKEADNAVQFWQKQTAQVRKKEAENEAMEARIAAIRSHESISPQAEQNLEYAKANTTLVEERQVTLTELDSLKEDLNKREESFESLKNRADAAEYSQAIGILLRNKHSSLPGLEKLRFQVSKHNTEISKLNLKIMEWESERKPLIDLSEAASNILKNLKTTPESISEDDLKKQLQEILSVRLKILGDLVENGRSQLDQLVSLHSKEKEMIAAISEESDWLAEHVLWVRSTGILGSNSKSYGQSFRTLFDKKKWSQLFQKLSADMRQNSFVWVIGMIVVILLFILRSSLKRRVRKIGEIASRSNCTSIIPTAQALFFTLVIIAPFPSAVWFLGNQLTALGHTDNFINAIGLSLQMIAGAWAIVEFVRQVSQKGGIGVAHFEWSSLSTVIVRKCMRLFTFIVLPLAFVIMWTEYINDDEVESSIGRLVFLITMALTGWVFFKFVNPHSPILNALKKEDENDFLWQTRWIWTGFLIVSPVVLAGLSIFGYHYSAVQMSGKVAKTIGVGFIALFISSYLSRWLLVTYRKLSIRRGQERRQQMMEAAQADPDAVIPPDATPELSLSDINTQARRLLHFAIGVVTIFVIYLIWIDVLPALGILRNFEMGWVNSAISQEPGSIPIPITAADVILAIIVAMITFIASKNLPGMFEIAILQRLPFDSGARYAISTVSKYIIVVSGLLLSFRIIGIGWSSVQWLVAAMTVGLGFGLQEIFANFVSGIILLFERPIRVGDTVTIGNVTGTVTRIQIRATTILDWDNRELIVPNREFVTGNLMNWTLSDPTLRLIVSVGVAYGSDTRLATKLLYEVAKENSSILKEPAPFVIFKEFGDSSLNFDLRAHVNGIQTYRQLHHELCLAIDDAFRKNHIEIAFPQRDLHVRSFPEELLRQQRIVSDD